MPQFVSLTPIVLSQTRVSIELATTDFPQKSNVFLEFNALSDQPDPGPDLLKDPDEVISDSPYPNVELSILDAADQEVAHLFIVEHKEEHISMTLHLRNPKVDEMYVARAVMIHNKVVIQTVTTPFRLQPNN